MRCAIKWFKHISDSLDDPFIFDLIRKHGAAGYLVFFGILEIYAREFKTQNGWKLDVTCDYLWRKLGLRTHRTLSETLLTISEAGKWEVEFKEDRIIINVLKFRRYLDETTLKKLREKEKVFRNHSGIIPKTEPTEVEVEVEVDIEEERKKEKEREKFLSDSFELFWEKHPGIKSGKKKCRDKWFVISPDQILFDKIMFAIEDQIIWRQTAKSSDFRPEWKNPITWLNQECWNDPTKQHVKPSPRYKDHKCEGCGEVFKLNIDIGENMCPHCHVFIRKKLPEDKPDSRIEELTGKISKSMQFPADATQT